MRRSFTIAVLLCAALVAGAQAQPNQASGRKTLVDLEAQAKAKKRTPTAGTTSTAGAQKSTAKAPAKTSARRAAPKKTTTTTDPAATAPEAAPADTAAATQGATTAPAAAAPAATAPATQNAPATPDPLDPNGKKIYKAGDIPDEWKFKKEKPAPKPAETKSVSEGAEASGAAAPAAAAAPEPTAVAAPAQTPSSSAAPSQTQTPRPRRTPPRQPTPAPAPTKPATTATSAAKPASRNANRWRDRAYISGNAGWQASSASFSDTKTLPVATGDIEPRHMTSTYDVKAGPMFDIGAGIRLWKNLGVAPAVTFYSVSKDINIDATVPHPFFLGRDRALSGTTSGTREELAIHVDAVWVVPGRKLQVAIFGGPTFFNAKQTVVGDFTYSDAYPFDDPPTFSSATSAEESKSVAGFNAGADVGYYFSDVFGVGGVVRFSRGTLKSSIGDLDVGGFQASGGIRIRLREGKPKPPAKTPPPPKTPPPAKKK